MSKIDEGKKAPDFTMADQDGKSVSLSDLKGKDVIVVTGEGNERKISLDEVPEGKRAGKGLKVVKRGQIAAIHAEE